ncbi:hypothetical protein BT96DRAFT_565586 [Gymnopus androsaceus JB14]|uniref:Uncharacterized protein n=1 Tax=Gymnopus androsaceus JB14 TaxID=1447944 RepID=A0A6A4GKJ5_9AGAR|nr:hypothetical protein BT96DRAFT_565586 [Gymnopus androsaceus JB14]
MSCIPVLHQLSSALDYSSTYSTEIHPLPSDFLSSQEQFLAQFPSDLFSVLLVFYCFTFLIMYTIYFCNSFSCPPPFLLIIWVGQ